MYRASTASNTVVERRCARAKWQAASSGSGGCTLRYGIAFCGKDVAVVSR